MVIIKSVMKLVWATIQTELLPLKTRTSLDWAAAPFWKWSPRSTPLRDLDSLSCTKRVTGAEPIEEVEVKWDSTELVLFDSLSSSNRYLMHCNIPCFPLRYKYGSEDSRKE